MTNETEKDDPTATPESNIADEALGMQADNEFPVEPSTTDQDDASQLRVQLAAADKEILRGRAELENLRKRLQRDADTQLKFANVPIVRDLLDVIDNLNRAVESARGDANIKSLLDGVQMVSQQFTTVLAKHGCKPIEATGADFDPNFHQAIAQMPSAEHAAGKVAMEVAVGYMLHDRVIRPATVMVSTGPAAPAANEPEAQ
jgi:molecular chaperone GrpE